jgi:hypothetical protein
MNLKKISYFAILILLLPALAAAVDFTIKGGSFTYKSGSITDDAISNSAAISADKLKHVYKAAPTSTWAQPRRRRPRRARSSWPRRRARSAASTSCCRIPARRRR